LDLKYVYRYRDRHGKWRQYLRRPGCKSIPLPGAWGSPEFMAAYQAAINTTATLSPKVSVANAGTMRALAIDYFKSVEYSNLSLSSQQTYRRVIETVCRRVGDRPVKDMPRDAAQKIILEIGIRRRGMANLTTKIIRCLMNFAIDRGIRSDNPFDRIKSYKIGTHHTWTDAELSAFEKRWPIGTRERLAYAVLLYTGQRGSDAVIMLRPGIKASAIDLTQKKTGREMKIAIHPELDRVIKATPANGVYLLGDATGRKLTRPALTNLIRRAVQEAGLPSRCKAHGLRKAILRRLAERGGTSKQLQAVSGHRSLSELERYTEMAEQARLNRQAMAKLTEEQNDDTDC
jgi:site-specific recombinase XerD